MNTKRGCFYSLSLLTKSAGCQSSRNPCKPRHRKFRFTHSVKMTECFFGSTATPYPQKALLLFRVPFAKKGVYTDVNDRILQVKCNDGNKPLQKFCRGLCLQGFVSALMGDEKSPYSVAKDN